MTRLPEPAPTCAECGRSWLDPSEPWRAVLTLEDDGSDGVGLFCEECAFAEFGDFA